MELRPFAIEHLFNKIDTSEGPVYWRDIITQDGWMIVWPDGEHLHTYRYPPDWLPQVLDEPI